MSMTRNDSLSQMAHGIRKYAGFTAAQIVHEPVASGLHGADIKYFLKYGNLPYQEVAEACQGRNRYTDPLAEKRAVGRPVSLDAGKRVNVYLDSDSLERAAKLGNGNVSEGIRIALQRAT